MKSKLVPFTKASMKKLGIVSTKNGMMIERQRLGDIKKFQRPKVDDPKAVVVKQKSVQEMGKEKMNKKDEDLGIF